ncbi:MULTISPECIES: hypothetical protein [unclassified Novosphingobium]|uniref:hypothetical protein n=1 Tax=unclassified Novosphingobium TaxID=2644732 RepID=UPI00086B89D7|nr:MULTISPECIES: hypothetical protein [unclassified Novosphingobium]MBN9143932.1 hypothetical protein [Novosphingobium sp.]MDR6709128.1 hypothetical protein [Novosphingobium sp. 1748]ODU77320.1 MAG: hypothetical protein ABT10_25025 [Novosphingobium sp. SCN 63-17]OJX95206.1 MAG: hypothetical protein BGP00_10185 [Novosphingobium sp. 63-713]
MFRFFLTAAALVAPLSAAAAETVRFIACPIYRDADSGKKSGCWLSDDPATGVRYDVSLSPHKPDWNYAVMVEGIVTAAPTTPCGGMVLDAVRTSRLYDTPCTRHMLPAEGFPGRRFVLPKRNITPSSVARPVPPGPYAERVFPVYFEFGNDFLIYQYGDYLIEQAGNWINAAHPKKLIVTGFAAMQPEVISGRAMAEPAELAAQRAETIAETLRRLMPGMPIETAADTSGSATQDKDADGLPSQSRRRVEIRALF